jgi:hypothetical protein
MIDVASFLKLTQVTHQGGQPLTFSLVFCKKDGSLRTIERARRFNLKTHHDTRILIIDEDEANPKPKEVIIDSIQRYNGQKVRH